MSHFVKRMTHFQWKENTQTEYKRLNINDTQGPGGSKDIIFRDWLKKPYLFSSGAHLSLSPPGCHGSSTGGTGSGGAGPHPTEARFPYRHSPHLTQTASQPPPTPTHTPSKTLAGNHTHAWSCQLPSLGPRWTYFQASDPTFTAGTRLWEQVLPIKDQSFHMISPSLSSSYYNYISMHKEGILSWGC